MQPKPTSKQSEADDWVSLKKVIICTLFTHSTLILKLAVYSAEAKAQNKNPCGKSSENRQMKSSPTPPPPLSETNVKTLLHDQYGLVRKF